MAKLPRLETERLTLRAFSLDDAPCVQKLAGAKEVAATTARVPHPYEDGMAESWIATHADNFSKGKGVELAIVQKCDGAVVGCIALMARNCGDDDEKTAEIGYWIGTPYWGKGYCTEAARRVLKWVLVEERWCRKVTGRAMGDNAGSNKVMQKLGMQYVNTNPGKMIKWGEKHDEVNS